MVIDVSAHLRRLVLAGLPLLGAGACLPEEHSLPPPILLPDAGLGTCAPRSAIPPGAARSDKVVNVGFDRQDPRLSDLYDACFAQGHYCDRLCGEVLAASQVAASTTIAGCELGCDQDGGAVATISYSTVVNGRRPEGFAGSLRFGPGTSLADFWSSCAVLEGVSVTAFRVLAAELELYDAPRSLVERARAAMGDEARHWRLTRGMARRQGAGPARFPRPAPPSPRSLADMAVENAAEGCVAETFAGALALWQAASAADPSVRAVMGEIAADELEHAQLAWDVDEWIRPRLTPADDRRVTQARDRAVRALARGSCAPVESRLVREAGLPAAPDAAALAARVTAALWA
jgi:hypothetical protein